MPLMLVTSQSMGASTWTDGVHVKEPVGVGVAVAVGLAVGVGVTVGLAVGVAVAVGLAVGVGSSAGWTRTWGVSLVAADATLIPPASRPAVVASAVRVAVMWCECTMLPVPNSISRAVYSV